MPEQSAELVLLPNVFEIGGMRTSAASAQVVGVMHRFL